ncbi:hypothetical protein D3C78_1631250 [compost metagenome]
MFLFCFFSFLGKRIFLFVESSFKRRICFAFLLIDLTSHCLALIVRCFCYLNISRNLSHRNLLTNQFLYFFNMHFLSIRTKSNCISCFISASGSAYSVHIIFVNQRNIKVDHMANVRNVQSTSRHICRY